MNIQPRSSLSLRLGHTPFILSLSNFELNFTRVNVSSNLFSALVPSDVAHYKYKSILFQCYLSLVYLLVVY